MKLKIYQVDAFTDKIFGGNPAAVCPLKEWLSDELLQNIAQENNLSETAFYVKDNNNYQIRWFTPTVEVDLCGHATFAAAFVLFHHEGYRGDKIEFFSPRSGKLTVTKNEDLLTLNFPADVVEQVELSKDLLEAFDLQASAIYKGKTDYLFVFNSEEDVRRLKPNLSNIAQLDARGLIATAKAKDVDFVSRFFGPQVGVDEDPVTGSAHTTLTPFWAEQLGKEELTAVQLSTRKGHLKCKYVHPRVEVSGQGRFYMAGIIEID
jgi:PhzF family phenazine biosynthesis protein